MATKFTENKTIVLPILEENYDSFINDTSEAHRVIKNVHKESPELFPEALSEQGYILKGKDRVSKKIGIQLRRIKTGDEIYRIRPSFVMPYMRAKTSEVENALLLIRFGVPFWVIALVFGRNAMFWYRTFICLSEFNMVGTTVYNPAKMPQHLIADEFHIRIRGVKAYIATVVGGMCFLGAEACTKADELSLRVAYGTFKTEAQKVLSKDSPFSINTDGWTATQNALKCLFVNTKMVECYLHAIIKIRDRATKKLEQYRQIAMDKAWNIYRTTSKKQMGQQIRRLREWTEKVVPESAFRKNLIKLCNKKKTWFTHFDAPEAYRTSAHLDRIMKNMERHSINSQMFHSNALSTTKNFRAFALLCNFVPSCPKVTKIHDQFTSPAARLNEFIYSDSWLENLLIAGSLNGNKT